MWLIAISAAFNKAKAYVNSVVAALANGFHYKGSVETPEDLPSSPDNGDLYTVYSVSGSYVWDGENWMPTGIRGIQGPEGPQGPSGRDGAHTVEASETGTSTTLAKYLTIDDNEYKIGSDDATWGAIQGNLADQTDLNAALVNKANLENGKIPLSELPSFIISTVVEVDTYEDLPDPGQSGTIYYVKSGTYAGKTFRWIGDAYQEFDNKNTYFSISITSDISTVAELKETIDRLNIAGEHAFIDLHAYCAEGYVCTVHFFDEASGSTTIPRCEVHDVLNGEFYGIGETYDSTTLLSDYLASPVIYKKPQTKVVYH